MSVVSHPNDVTPEWLNGVFAVQGFSGRVEAVTHTMIGAGQVGDNARFYLSGQGDLPHCVVGKFPSSDPVSRKTGAQLGNYAKEVAFYNDLAPTLDVQVPRLFTTEFDPATHDFVILMEDLAPGVQVDQMSQCSVDQAAMAVEELAKLHGPRWGDETLKEHPMLVPNTEGPAPGELYALMQPGFLARYQNRMSEAEQKMVDQVGRVQTSYGAFSGVQTLIHIDYRLDNMIFGGPHPLTILDWQSYTLGCAINDLSYFMGTSLSAERRRTHEKYLVQHYLDVLNSYGVGLSQQACWRLYRHYAPAGLIMAVIASMIVGETERGNDMFMTMAIRSTQMCAELETLTLLNEG